MPHTRYLCFLRNAGFNTPCPSRQTSFSSTALSLPLALTLGSSCTLFLSVACLANFSIDISLLLCPNSPMTSTVTVTKSPLSDIQSLGYSDLSIVISGEFQEKSALSNASLRSIWGVTVLTWMALVRRLRVCPSRASIQSLSSLNRRFQRA